jgi:hypothetical protein
MRRASVTFQTLVVQIHTADQACPLGEPSVQRAIFLIPALLCLVATSATADDPLREVGKYYSEQQREADKAMMESDREHQKLHEEMDREERKHFEEMEREDGKRQAEFYRELEKTHRE